MLVIDFTYAYLIGSLVLFLVWLALYFIYAELRSKILLVSLLTASLGLTEPLFVPSYWRPLTLFNLAERIGFDLESLLFAFGVGGIAAVIYESLTHKTRRHMSEREMRAPRHRFHRLALASPVITFLLFYFFTNFNPIYSTIAALGIGVFATWLCRRDLLKPMIIGGVLFGIIYFVVFFVVLVWLFPGYVETVWNLEAISGILIGGAPIEELIFAILLGALWSSIYEHFGWYKFS